MVDIQWLLDNVGASELVIDLIVSTKNDRVFEESVLLGIALLRGGNTQIQVQWVDRWGQVTTTTTTRLTDN